MRVLIVSGGLEPSYDILHEALNKTEIIIGVDRGCTYLLKNNVKPMYIMGDFDSISKDTYNKLSDNTIVKVEFNPEKDFTDTEAAFDFAINNLKATEIILLGATGKRIDHFIGNLGVLKRALNRGVKAFIKDEYNEIYLTNKNHVIEETNYKYISFQAYENEIKDFSIKKAKYELDNYTLRFGDPLTISNEFIGTPIEVRFTNGTLIIIKSKD